MNQRVICECIRDLFHCIGTQYVSRFESETQNTFRIKRGTELLNTAVHIYSHQYTPNNILQNANWVHVECA